MITPLRLAVFAMCLGTSGMASAGTMMRAISSGHGDDGQMVRAATFATLERAQPAMQNSATRSVDANETRVAAANASAQPQTPSDQSDGIRRLRGQKEQAMLRDLEMRAAIQRRSDGNQDMTTRLLATLDEKGRRPVTIGGVLPSAGAIPISFKNKPLQIFGREYYEVAIAAAARVYGVDEALVRTIIHVESAYRSSARSAVGALGLMQLMPATARRFGVINSYDPNQNIDGGTRYLAFLLKRYQGNVALAAAAYNAGEGAVDRYGGIPPYRETRGYVERVSYLLPFYRSLTHS